MEGLKHIDASLGGLISLLEVVVAIAFGVSVFGEQIYLSTILGAAFIIVAAAIPNIVDMAKHHYYKTS